MRMACKSDRKCIQICLQIPTREEPVRFVPERNLQAASRDQEVSKSATSSLQDLPGIRSQKWLTDDEHVRSYLKHGLVDRLRVVKVVFSIHGTCGDDEYSSE